MLRCVSACRTVSTEAVCVLADIPLIEIIADEFVRVYSATHWISPGSGKALQFRFDEMQVPPHTWEERLSGSSKRKWIRLLIHNLKAWLERCYGQMNFYLTQVMFGHGTFNMYVPVPHETQMRQL